MSTMNQLGKYQPYPDYKDSGVSSCIEEISFRLRKWILGG